ncbi:MAG: DEAD/DEAH box helicase [Nitrospiraceae bacterium]
MKVTLEDGKLYIDCGRDPLDVAKAQAVPGRRYLKVRKVWSAPPSLVVFEYLQRVWPKLVCDQAASDAFDACKGQAVARQATLEANYGQIDVSRMDGVQFKTEPFFHQRQALALGAHQDIFGYLMDQGTGKTWTLINDMAINYRAAKIDAVIVLVPNSIKQQWAEQIEQHLPDDVPRNVGIWTSVPNAAQKKANAEWIESFQNNEQTLHWYIVNVEAVGMARCVEFLEQIAKQSMCAIVVDESTRIKNRTAKRTKGAVKVRKHCVLARIMSGTPVIKSPMDAYSQFGFLDADILGYTNFFSFRGQYGVMGGYKNKQVVAYKNTAELSKAIKSCSFRVTKEECLDLPEKLYARRDVTMQPEQKAEYQRMRQEMLAMLERECETCEGQGWIEVNDEAIQCLTCNGMKSAVSVTIALTQMLRLQQITCGFITDGPELLHWFTDKPPKIMECMDIIEDADTQQILCWSNFRPEIDRLCQELALRGISYGELHGGISEDGRNEFRNSFQAGNLQVGVCHPAAGGIGVDLWRASIANYLSNSHKTEDRVQSEDRCHRIGSEIHDNVFYNDIVVPGTVDVKVLRVIRTNRNLSDEIMASGLRGLIE